MNKLNKTSDKALHPLKICLLSDHHICMNPRLWKEAFFYEKQGFEVIIVNMWQSKALLLNDLDLLKGHTIQYEAYLNLIPDEISSLHRFFYRARKRLSCEVQHVFKISFGWAISHAPEKMLKSALLHDADLYVAHLECAFFAGRELIKAGKKVSFDFEDWYSRDYLVPERPVKLLEELEKFALQFGLFCTAASGSMVMALKKYYKSTQEITVIYNGFSAQELIRIEPAPQSANGPHPQPIKLLWFSRTIGPNRGIEFLLKALNVCEVPVELHLLGTMAEGYGAFLADAFPNRKGHQLVIHPFIPHFQLMPFIAKFKIGLAIEENLNDNKKLTISNKILQYLQSGLLVIASDTKGQREVADFFPDSVCIIDIEKPLELVNAIRLLSERPPVDEREQYQQIFSWEAQEGKLIDLIKKHL